LLMAADLVGVAPPLSLSSRPHNSGSFFASAAFRFEIIFSI
jgi:hypothetical protein